MTFEQYKQGLKEVARTGGEAEIKAYNANVNSECNFKVRVGDLVDNIQKIHPSKRSITSATIRLSTGFDNSKIGEEMIGRLTVATTYNSEDLYKEVVVTPYSSYNSFSSEPLFTPILIGILYSFALLIM
jgi:hypothetical protein